MMKKSSIQNLQIFILLLSCSGAAKAADKSAVKGSERSLQQEEQERQLFYEEPEPDLTRKDTPVVSKDTDRLPYDPDWYDKFLDPPSGSPSTTPSVSFVPSYRPSETPSGSPSISNAPTESPSQSPSQKPTPKPTPNPTSNPTPNPTGRPTRKPTPNPTQKATPNPTRRPTRNPTPRPTQPPVRTTGITYVPGKLTVNENGLLLSKGLRSRIIARVNQKVRYANGSQSRDRFHDEPDGAAVVAQPDGGWIYVTNSEENGGGGGVGAIKFNRHGDVVDYKMLLRGTTRNCSGGKTPWGTWVSCEEHRGGKIWQVDPTGRRGPQVTSMSPDSGDFESFAYDIRNMKKPRFFVTEDNNGGALRRFTPSNPNWNDPWNILHRGGTLEYLVLTPRGGTNREEGTYSWTRDLGRARRSAESFYRYSEGLDVYNNELFFTSKSLKSLFILNLDGNTYRRFSTRRGLFDGQPDQMQRLIKDSNVQSSDNFNATQQGENALLYFCEDGGREAGIHARDRNGWFFTILESTMNTRETTGLAFSPDGKHMYFSYQMKGIIFDVWREDGQPFYGNTLDVHYHQRN